MRIETLLLASAIALAIARPALADPKVEAKQRVERATTLYEAAQFNDALEELMTAYALDPQPEVLYAIAQVNVRLDRCPQAITFYERFLDTKPKAGPAAAAHKAIEHCKAKPSPDPHDLTPTVEPTVKPEPVAEPRPAPKAEPDVTAAPPPVRAPTPARRDVDVVAPTAHHWYADPPGDVLVGSGIAAGVVGGLFLRAALDSRDQADATTSYRRYSDLVDRAHRDRTYAIVAGAGAVALIGVGCVRIVMHDRDDERAIAIAPVDRGGIIVWGGRW